jgi:xanthine/uracil permease
MRWYCAACDAWLALYPPVKNGLLQSLPCFVFFGVFLFLFGLVCFPTLTVVGAEHLLALSVRAAVCLKAFFVIFFPPLRRLYGAAFRAVQKFAAAPCTFCSTFFAVFRYRAIMRKPTCSAAEFSFFRAVWMNLKHHFTRQASNPDALAPLRRFPKFFGVGHELASSGNA